MEPVNQQPWRQVGVIGGGQLAGMMAEAAQKLGVEVVVQTAQPDDPAVPLAHQAIIAPLQDVQATAQLAKLTQVITFENEFVDLDALTKLAEQGICFRPGLNTLAPLLDKLDQRCYLQTLGLPEPQFAPLTLSEEDTQIGPAALGFDWPLVIKARRHGYDGQGTFVLRNPSEWQQWLAKFGPPAGASPEEFASQFLVEAYVPFSRELAVLAARFPDGQVVIYPVVETQQEQQVCRRVFLTADLEPTVTIQAEQIAQTLLTRLGVIGLWGIELFLTASGQVLVNEIAPRTHNSGHFSQDAWSTSQFEQHLRAICGFPPGLMAPVSPGAVMVNLLGFETAQSDYRQKRQQLAALPAAHVHWYGKTQAKPGRKLGHVTVLLDTPEQLVAAAMAKRVEAIWYGEPPIST
jgi:5-(carboxyamino)imidazole ribonucleotide synthase